MYVFPKKVTFFVKKVPISSGCLESGVGLCYFLGDKGNIWKLGYFANVSYY